MVDVTPLIPEGKQVIDAYGDGGFRIANQRYEHAVIILPDKTLKWNVTSVESLTADDMEGVIAHKEDIDVLLIGCGERQQFLPAEVEKELAGHRIIPEQMDTGAACRTYNVLLSEERAVAVALIPV